MKRVRHHAAHPFLDGVLYVLDFFYGVLLRLLCTGIVVLLLNSFLNVVLLFFWGEGFDYVGSVEAIALGSIMFCSLTVGVQQKNHAVLETYVEGKSSWLADRLRLSVMVVFGFLFAYSGILYEEGFMSMEAYCMDISKQMWAVSLFLCGFYIFYFAFMELMGWEEYHYTEFFLMNEPEEQKNE